MFRKTVNIFYINKAQLIKVHIHPEENYTDLQNYINEQTDVWPENQILLFKSNLFTNIVRENSKARSYPEATEEEPLFLFDKANNNVTVVLEQSLPNFNKFGNVISIEIDTTQARNAYNTGVKWTKQIEKYSLSCRHFINCVENFVQYINKELKEVNQFCDCLLEKKTILKMTTYFLESSQCLASFRLNDIPPITYVDELKKLSEYFISQTVQKIRQLNRSHVIDNTLQSEWDTSSHLLKCPVKSRASERARTEVQRLKDSWQCMLRINYKHSLSHNDQQFHILERIKITNTFNRVNMLLQKEVVPQYVQLAENLGDWYKSAQIVYLQLTILKMDVLDYENKLKKFEFEMFIKNEQYLEKVRNSLERDATDKSSKKVHNSNNEQLKKSLCEYNRKSVQINDIILERAQILEQVNRTLEELTIEETRLSL